MVDNNEFSVVQYFPDGSYEYWLRFVGAEKAFQGFMHCASSVGAQIGTTRRVIVTDGYDFTTMEWKFGEGVTFPPGYKDLVERWRARGPEASGPS